MRIRWTEEALIAEMKQHTTRTSFSKKYGAGYKKAKKLGLLDKYLPSNIHLWTREEIQAEALKYNTRDTFRVGSNDAYGAAQRAGCINEVCAHMKQVLEHDWTVDKLKVAATPYLTRTNFKHGRPSAYKKALELGVMNVICAHMGKQDTLSDNDTIYIWKVVGFDNIYKVGVTSKRLGDRRIKDTIRNSGFDGELIYMKYVNGLATTLEREIHDKYPSADLGYFDGYTEYIEVDDIEEIITALSDC